MRPEDRGNSPVLRHADRPPVCACLTLCCDIWRPAVYICMLPPWQCCDHKCTRDMTNTKHWRPADCYHAIGTPMFLHIYIAQSTQLISSSLPVHATYTGYSCFLQQGTAGGRLRHCLPRIRRPHACQACITDLLRRAGGGRKSNKPSITIHPWLGEPLHPWLEKRSCLATSNNSIYGRRSAHNT